VALTLARSPLRAFLSGQGIPLRMPLTDSVGAVRLGQAIDVHGTEVQVLELGEQRGRGRRPRDGDRHRAFEPVRRRMIDDADLHGGSAVVVRHALGVEQLPDPTGLDSPETDVRAGNRGDGPRETPAVAVEHRKGPEVASVEAHGALDELAERVQVDTP